MDRAGEGDIVATQATLDEARVGQASAPEPADLRGIAGPVEIAWVSWR
jgi:class 3 adenylate cyclase